MIAAQSLSKRFGAQEVLRGVDFSLRAGAVTGLVGPNGAGKTTLIKLLLGLARPDSGLITMNGAPTPGEEYRRRIGYMPQMARFPENLTAREVIALLRG